MDSKRTFFCTLAGRLLGEVPSDTLEAYRRASLSVFELLDRMEARRAEAKAAGNDPWSMPLHQQAEMLCAWNAFVLQSLGNEFLDADYEDHPSTAGMVPPITADQVLAFYTEVESWLSRAHEAGSNPSYRLTARVPSPPPAWSEVEPCPNSHLHGMLNAMRAIKSHAETALAFLPESNTDPQRQEQAHRIRGLFAAALSKARYSEDLHGGHPTPDVHERVEPHIKQAIEEFFLLGQLLAMPSLADQVNSEVANERNKGVRQRIPGPGESGFDPWRLTSPDSVRHWKSDAKARQAIATLWKLDPDPRRTLDMQAEIEDALGKGDVGYATSSGRRLGHFFCCPWGPVYQAKRNTTLCGQRLNEGQQFVFDVTAEGVNIGASFRRELKLGNYQPTNEHEYGDPDEAPDH